VGIWPFRTKEKHKDYSRYAATCRDTMVIAPNQKARTVQHEMAAEWLNLADAIIELSTPIKTK
jgi:hypothetical protein